MEITNFMFSAWPNIIFSSVGIEFYPRLNIDLDPQLENVNHVVTLVSVKIRGQRFFCLHTNS